MLNNPYIAKLLAEARIDDLRRDASSAALARDEGEDARGRSDRAGVTREPHPVLRPSHAGGPGCDPCVE
jgi:hypothetical protein